MRNSVWHGGNCEKWGEFLGTCPEINRDWFFAFLSRGGVERTLKNTCFDEVAPRSLEFLEIKTEYSWVLSSMSDFQKYRFPKKRLKLTAALSVRRNRLVQCRIRLRTERQEIRLRPGIRFQTEIRFRYRETSGTQECRTERQHNEKQTFSQILLASRKKLGRRA